MAKEEKSQRSSLSEWLRFGYDRVEQTFENNIPFDTVKELDFKFILCFGLLLYAVYYALFGFFMYHAYHDAINTQYISLHDADNCDSVPISTTGTFLADINGHWEGQPKFLYSKSPYQLVLTSFAVDSVEEYGKMIKAFKVSLEEVSVKSRDVGLIYSLLVWMTYVRYYSLDNTIPAGFSSVGYGSMKYILLHSEPSYVFNLRHTEFFMGTSKGVCDASPHVVNSPYAFTISAEYDIDTFQSNYYCNQTLDVHKFDLYATTGECFLFSIDTRSFATAMSVNYGILKLTDLAEIANSSHSLTIDGVDYMMASYFDIRYAGMDPIVCIRNVSLATDMFSDTHLCTLTKGTGTLGFPVFNHVGSSYNASYPSYCSGESYTDDICSLFKLMSGLVVFPPAYNTMSRADGIKLQEDQMTGLMTMLNYGDYKTYKQFNKAAYNASFIISRSTNTQFDSQFGTTEFFKESFKFCGANGANSDITCSLLMFNQFDYFNNYVNSYNYRLENGAVDGGFTIFDDSWNSLIVNPPVSIIEPYYECHPRVVDTLQNSQGIAAGNIDMAMMVIVPLIFGPLVYFLLFQKDQKPETEVYQQKHKNELNDMLMNLLLRTMSKAEQLAKQPELQKAISRIVVEPPDLTLDEIQASTELQLKETPGNDSLIKGLHNDGPIMAFGKELYEFSQVLQDEESERSSASCSCCYKKVEKNRNATLLKRANTSSGKNAGLVYEDYFK